MIPKKDGKVKKGLSKLVRTLLPVMPFILTLVITILSFLPGKIVSPLVKPFPFSDHGAHAFAYAVFAFFTHLTLRHGRPLRNCVIVLGSALILGLSIELLQPFFHRSFELNDLIADLLGALVGYLVALLWLRKRMRQKDE